MVSITKISKLKQGRFRASMSTGSGLFASLSCCFAQIFRANHLYKKKYPYQQKASRHMTGKKEKASLPVDERRT